MKNTRHSKLVEIILENEIQTQEELVSKLNEAGYPVTQATVSRDIKQLHVIKVPMKNGGQKYALHEGGLRDEDRYSEVLRAGFVSMADSQHILVIRTGAGMAMAVAAAVDALKLPQIIGSIAGDDTVMCAMRSKEDCEEVMNQIRMITGVM